MRAEMAVEYMSRKVVVKVEKRTIIMAGTASPRPTINSSTMLSGVGDCVASAAARPMVYIQELTMK